MKESWFKHFWNTHGDRLIFATLSISIATVLYQIGMKAEAKTIIVGIGMLFFNKTRGTNNK